MRKREWDEEKIYRSIHGDMDENSSIRLTRSIQTIGLLSVIISMKEQQYVLIELTLTRSQNWWPISRLIVDWFVCFSDWFRNLSSSHRSMDCPKGKLQKYRCRQGQIISRRLHVLTLRGSNIDIIISEWGPNQGDFWCCT